MVNYIKFLILLIVILSFCACGYFTSDKVSQRVKEGIETIELDINLDYSKTRDTLNMKYKKLIQSKTNTVDRQKIVFFYSNVLNTLDYIDSLKLEINRLNNSESVNSALIKKMFVTDGIGDSVFNKLKLSFDLTERISIGAKIKSPRSRKC